MRLSVLFLTVLALSAIVTSMAAWGITYGTAYSRVSPLALQFISLAQGSLAGFGSFVTDLLGANVVLVEAVLTAQEQSGIERSRQTAAQTLQTVGVLVNYTSNTTDQTQQQVGEVMDAFGNLVGSVVAQFKGLASGYMSEVRTNLAAKGSASVTTAALLSAIAKQRIQQLVNNGLVDLSRALTDPVGEPDCTLLGVLCDTAKELAVGAITIVSATGRYYSCGTQDDAAVTYRTVSGGVYNESQMNWFTFVVSNKTIKQRCLTEKPVISSLGKNCSVSQTCACGKDYRCFTWYQPHVNTTSPSFITGLYTDPILQMHNTMSLFNLSANPPVFLGVVDSTANLAQTQKLLPALPGVSNQTYLALLLNDTYLTMMGTLVRSCAPGFTKLGNASLPTSSAFRSCDMGLRLVAQWIVDNRVLNETVTLEIDGLLWDVSPVKTLPGTYFFVVGTNKSEVYRALDVSEAKAVAQLAALRSAVTRRTAAAGAAARAYVADLGARNLLATQAMQDAFLAEIGALENTSRAALTASQESSAANAQLMKEGQASAVEAQRIAALDTMVATAGWTVTVVCLVFLGALLHGAVHTIRVTNSLNNIIGLMEDVAEMRVENLVVLQTSSVEEVDRIQTAFEVMVHRLAEYKSYIPAGVFEQLLEEERTAPTEDGHESDQRSEASARHSHVSHRHSHASDRRSHASDVVADRRASSHLSNSGHHSAVQAAAHIQKLSGLLGVPAAIAGRRSATRQVAVLAVNVASLLELLGVSNEVLAKTVFNDCIMHIHEVVSQGRGNVDFLAGDQVFVTFNAHVPCGDPSGAVAAVALDLRQQLLRTLGDRLKFSVGVSCGTAFATAVGYAKFKFMATVGSPMTLAETLSRLERLENGAIVVDANVHERLKYSYTFRPVELLYVPWLKSLARDTPREQRVSMLVGKKTLQEDEWLYQVNQGTESAWDRVFERLAAAPSAAELQCILGQYLEAHPDDDLALRLRDRLQLWVPGCGIPA